jgi:acyl-CoA reductase-like NAD-dependent aldehyde dehydrogenase
MKQQVLRFAPWVALMILGVIGTSRPANTTPPQPERHPHIRAAANELREANEELRTAAHDFCGHRVEAMRAIEAARRQLQLALECAR